MAILNLDDWADIIQANPILDDQQCSDLQESVHAGVFDDTKMVKIFQYCGVIDFVNSHIVLWRIFKNFVKNYAFDDDAPEPEPPDYVWDVITKRKGDFLEREIDKITNFPIQLRNETIIELGNEMGGCLSTKLQTAIDALNI